MEVWVIDWGEYGISEPWVKRASTLVPTLRRLAIRSVDQAPRPRYSKNDPFSVGNVTQHQLSIDTIPLSSW